MISGKSKHFNYVIAVLVCFGLLSFGYVLADAQPKIDMQAVSAKPTVITVTLGKPQKVLIPGKYPKTNARLVTVPEKRGERPMAIKGMALTMGDMDKKRTGRYFTFVTSTTKPAAPGKYQLEYYDSKNKKWQAVPLSSVQINIVAPPKAVAERAETAARRAIAAKQPAKAVAPAQGAVEVAAPQGTAGPDLAFESCAVHCNRGGGYSTELCQQEGYRDDFMYMVISNLRNNGDEAASIEEGWKVWSATHQHGSSAPAPIGYAQTQEAQAGGIYLTPGNEVTGTNRPALYAIKDLSPGTHRIVFTGDPDNHIAEADEGNNTSECVWEVVALPTGPPFDLTVTHVSVSPSSGPPSTAFQFTVTIKNIGGPYYGGMNTTCQPGTGFNAPQLEENESKTRTFPIGSTLTPGQKTITCTVDAFEAEQDTSNNSKSATFTVTAP